MKELQILQRLPGDPIASVVIDEPWYERDLETPQYLLVSHMKMKAHLTQEVAPGGAVTVYIQPPGKEAGGRDCASIEARYEVLKSSRPDGEASGRVNLIRVRNYMVTSRKYWAEVLAGDTVELWPTAKADYFVMGLIKELCWVCGRETGDAANGLAYICDDCNKSVHAKCAGLKRDLREEEDFFCRRCRPTVAEDEIGEGSEGKEGEASGEVQTTEEGKAPAEIEEGAAVAKSQQGENEEKKKSKSKSKSKSKRKRGDDEDGTKERKKKRKPVEGDAADPKAKRRSKSAANPCCGTRRGHRDAAAAGSSAAK